MLNDLVVNLNFCKYFFCGNFTENETKATFRRSMEKTAFFGGAKNEALYKTAFVQLDGQL